MVTSASKLAPKTARDGVARLQKGQRTQANVPVLAELQDLFQRAVLSGDETILSLIPANSHTSAEVLFGVYRYAYLARLRDCLASDHEHLAALMGRDAFDDMANAYLAAYPSRYCNVRWLASDLPKFLSETEPYRAAPHLADLARLEKALTDAFDAEDQEALTLHDLQSISPENWPALTFSPHPSACRLRVTSNAFALWSALRDGRKAPEPEPFGETQAFLVWRQDQTSRVRFLSDEEAMLWDEAAKGVAFGRLCELLGIYADPETAPLRAAQFLQTWLSSELLVRERH